MVAVVGRVEEVVAADGRVEEEEVEAVEGREEEWVAAVGRVEEEEEVAVEGREEEVEAFKVPDSAAEASLSVSSDFALDETSDFCSDLELAFFTSGSFVPLAFSSLEQGLSFLFAELA